MNELKVVEYEYDNIIKYTSIIKSNLGHLEEIDIKIPSSERNYITKSFDPFLVMNIFRLMLLGGEWHIRGEVSKSLLDNLENFCICWNIWRPDIYKPITLIADKELDDSKNINLNNDAVTCFSGGLDACFTVYQHAKKLAGRNNKNIKKAIMLYGADIPIGSKELFDKAFNYSKIMLDDLNIELIPVETNYRLLKHDWNFEYVASLVGISSLYKENYSNVIVSSSVEFNAERFDASNSMSNRFLGQNKFNVITYGEYFTRTEKANAIRDWELGLKHVRVCWAGEDKSKNCCVCEKCQRTILNFKACGIKNVPAFESYEVNLNNIHIYEEIILDFYKDILKYNEQHNHLDKNIVDQIHYLIDINTNHNISNNHISNENIYNKIEDMNNKLNKFINALAWFIPIRKWREDFRNKIYN